MSELIQLARPFFSQRRPEPIHLCARKVELLRTMPSLAGLPDPETRKLARSLYLRRMSPGDLLHRREDPPGRAHLIGSGAVSVASKLGPGGMFGHVSILARSPRRIEARVLTHGTLFRLDEAALRGLLGRCPELRKRIEDRIRTLAEQEDQEGQSQSYAQRKV